MKLKRKVLGYEHEIKERPNISFYQGPYNYLSK